MDILEHVLEHGGVKMDRYWVGGLVGYGRTEGRCWGGEIDRKEGLLGYGRSEGKG